MRSEVMRNRNTLSHRDFGLVFNVPSNGLRVGSSLPCPWEETKEKIDASLCKENYEGHDENTKFLMHSGILTVNNRLLHYFLAYIICPKTNNTSQMNITELYLLRAIVEEKQIDWAFQMRRHVMSTLELKGSKFPYGC